MIRYLKTRNEPLTPAIASEFAKMPPHKGERALKPHHLAWLVTKIADGMFHPPRWAVAHVHGRTYRVNGQHSSNALVSSNGTFPSGLRVFIDEFACDTDDDVADLFAQFDAKKSVRTDGEILMASARQHAELNDLRPTQVHLGVVAVSGYLAHVGRAGTRQSAEERRAMIIDHMPFIRWSTQYTGRGRMRKVGILAALAGTYMANPSAADAFWRAVVNEDHPDQQNPTRTLGRFIYGLDGGQEFDRQNGKPWLPRAVFVKCLHAWNAWRRGDTTRLTYYDGAPVPDIGR